MRLLLVVFGIISLIICGSVSSLPEQNQWTTILKSVRCLGVCVCVKVSVAVGVALCTPAPAVHERLVTQFYRIIAGFHRATKIAQ